MTELEQSWADRLGDAGEGAKAGAALGATIGSIVPGVGTAIGGAAGGVIGGAVALARSLTGQPHAEAEAPALAQAVQDVTGIADQTQAVAVLQADPVKLEAFRLEALDIRAKAEAARDAAITERFRDALADNAGARTMALAQKDRVTARFTMALDAAIIASFVGLLLVVMLRGLPDSEISRLIVLPAFGVLGTLVTQVIQFHRGSSASSQVKTQLLAAERERR